MSRDLPGARPSGDPAAGTDRSVRRRDVWVRMLLYPGHTIPTAAAPAVVALGLAEARGVLAPLPAVGAFLAGWMVQLGGVFTDNYTNLVRHPHDREHALFVEALKRGVVRLGELRWAIYASYGLALAVGGALVWIGGVPVLAIGLASVAGSLAYSVGPLRLGDRALGEPLFFLFFGVVSVVGVYYVQAASALVTIFPVGPPHGSLPADAFVAGIPVGALTTNILLIDNVRDREFDREKGETTLTVLIGEERSRTLYRAFLALAWAVPAGMTLAGRWPPAVLLTLAALPYALLVDHRLRRSRDYADLLPLTPQAGRCVLLFSALLGLAFAVG